MALKEKFARVGADVESAPPSAGGRGSRTRASQRAARRAATAPARRGDRKILALTYLALAFLALYALIVGSALTQGDYGWADRAAALALSLGLLYIVVHSVGYANSLLKANGAYRATRPPLFASSQTPRVACLVAAFNEPPEVLEETVAAVVAMDYPHRDIFILDDSTKPESREAARDIAARYGVRCVQRANRRGYKAGAINDFLPQIEAHYLALFDADALPTPQFLRECVPQIHENPRLALLQTPQFYANTHVSYVALASARQQNVFYETICEGKSVSRAAFCCGTNVLFRREALQSVGGFDESNVVEDFATSFYLHFKGWDSLYLNRVYVYSLAPENLAAYFTQQSRWSFGTLGTARSFLKAFVRNPRALSAGQWWEYFLSASYYWIGWVNFLFLCLPLATLFFGVKPLHQDALTYLLVFVPYLLFNLNMFYSSMEARGYPLGEIVLGQQIGFISFPIHMGSAVSGMLGRKRPFGVTPKGVGGRIAWKSLWPQLLMLLLSLCGFVYGVGRVLLGAEANVPAVAINAFWALYHVWMLGSVFRLNEPVRVGAEKSFFDDAAQPSRRAAPLPALEGARSPITARRVGCASALLGLGALGVVGYEVAAWNAAPLYPINVAVLDRTGGPNGGQHRSLLWTLNYLKIRKQPAFGATRGSLYGTSDYFGAVPDPRAKVLGGRGARLVYDLERSLPQRLATPGALVLADTFGQWEEPDGRGGVLTHRGARRGLTPSEVDAIETFARRGGLLLGEWNTLGFPTRPGNTVSPALLDRAIDGQRARLARLGRETIPAAREALRVAQAGTNFKRISIARGRLEDARGALTDATYKLRGLQGATISNAVSARQDAAATRLETLLGVAHAGWYGHFVASFADQKQFDPREWNAASLAWKADGRPGTPRGAGFAFYPDGPSLTFDPATATLRMNKALRPVFVWESELDAPPARAALIVPERATGDPLQAGIAAQVPARGWFELVTPRAGARVVASYRLSVAAAAGQKLQSAGFPLRALARDGRSLVFPALVASRDGANSQGRLRSLYFAGDAGASGQVSPPARRVPALGALDALAAPRFGDDAARFYWGFYEPVLRVALTQTPQLRYNHSGVR